jgi:hypothetical protein
MLTGHLSNRIYCSLSKLCEHNTNVLGSLWIENRLVEGDEQYEINRINDKKQRNR